MPDELVDKGVDADEIDDDAGGGARRPRRWLIGGGAAAALLAGGLAVAQPWSDSSSPAVTTSPLPGGVPVSEQTEPSLANRLALPETPDGYTLEWVNDGEAGGFQPGVDPVMATFVLLAAEGANMADGPWLSVRVAPLDRFERRDFDPDMYVSFQEGQSVRIGDLEGVFVADNFSGTSELAYGPVIEGYVVSLGGEGLTQADMLALAHELTLAESATEVVAWPQLGPTAAELGLLPRASFALESFGFSGGSVLDALWGGSMTSSSVMYGTADGDMIAITNDRAPAGADLLAVARFAFDDVQEVTVHGQPAVAGTSADLFAGAVVLWVEGGRLISVMGGGDTDEMVELAESVELLDEQEWADLIEEADDAMVEESSDPAETWLIGVGEMADGTTWLIEGALTDDGTLTLCSGALQTMGSSSGCEVGAVVEAPSLVSAGLMSVDGDAALGYVAAVGNDMAGALLRFTGADGTVVEVALHQVRPEWPYLVAAVAVQQAGVLEVLAADGTVLVADEVDITMLEMFAVDNTGGAATETTAAASG